MTIEGIFRRRPWGFVPLAIVATATSALAALIGVFADVYRDNRFTEATWLGGDVVTLVIAVPVLVVAIVFARRGSARGQLVLLGALAATAYNYAFFLFGAALNDMFLIHVTVLAASIYALILGLGAIDTEAVLRRTDPTMKVRFAAGFLLFVAIGLATVEKLQLLLFAANGTVPDVVVNTGHPTHVVAALDLTIAMPALLIAGVLLWRRHAWGTVLATVMAVKGAVYMANLTVASVVASGRGFDDAAAQIPLWGAIGVGCLAVAVHLLRHVHAPTADPMTAHHNVAV